MLEVIDFNLAPVREIVKGVGINYFAASCEVSLRASLIFVFIPAVNCEVFSRKINYPLLGVISERWMPSTIKPLGRSSS